MNENNIKVLFPEGIETITISKNDYDRLFGQLSYENIILKSKIEKAIEILNAMKHCQLLLSGRKKTNVDKLLDILKENE